MNLDTTDCLEWQTLQHLSSQDFDPDTWSTQINMPFKSKVY